MANNLKTIQEELTQVAMIGNLTALFEGIASLKIRQIRTGVISSKKFFDELWKIYQGLHIDTKNHQLPKGGRVINKTVYVVISSQTSLSGQFDARLINHLTREIKPGETDIIVIGRRGAVLLEEKNIKPMKVFDLPKFDRPINASPIIGLTSRYKKALVYYQTYVSLNVQEIRSIELSSAISKLTEDQQKKASPDFIFASQYIFEPSLKDVIIYLERVMQGVALSQVFFESRLAQYASRFTTMSDAHSKAKSTAERLSLAFKRSQRAKKDEALREIVYSKGPK